MRVDLPTLLHRQAEYKAELRALKVAWNKSALYATTSERRIAHAARSFHMQPAHFWLEFTRVAVELLRVQMEIVESAHGAGSVTSDQAPISDVTQRWVAACQLREVSRPSRGQYTVDIVVMLRLVRQAEEASVDVMLAIIDA